MSINKKDTAIFLNDLKSSSRFNMERLSHRANTVILSAFEGGLPSEDGKLHSWYTKLFYGLNGSSKFSPEL